MTPTTTTEGFTVTTATAEPAATRPADFTPPHLRYLFAFVVRIDRPDGPQFLPLVIGRYWRSADRRPELVQPDRVLSGEFHSATVGVREAASIVNRELAEFGRSFGATGAAVLAVSASHQSVSHSGPDSGAAIELAAILGVK